MVSSPYHANAKTITITPGTTDTGGTLKITITDAGGEHPVSILIDGPKNQREKAELITSELSNQHFTSSATIAGLVSVDFVNKICIAPNTFEHDAATSDDPFATLSFSGALTGMTPAGDLASYEAMLLFDDVAAVSVLTLSDLSTRTIAGLMTATFNNLRSQLPVGQQSNLLLDPSGNSMTFYFHDGAINATVGMFTSDVGVVCEFCLDTVPEPSTRILIAMGGMIGSIYGLVRRSRRAAGRGRPAPRTWRSRCPAPC